MWLRVWLLLAAIAITVGVSLCLALGYGLAARMAIARGMAVPIGKAKDFPSKTVELRMLPAAFMDDHPAAGFFAAGVAGRPRPELPGPLPVRVSPVPVYLAADEHGKLRALYQRDPESGCAYPWQAGQNKFIDPCHGSTYTLEGECVDGPCVRGLDRFAIERRIDGQLIVRIDRFEHGPPRKEP